MRYLTSALAGAGAVVFVIWWLHAPDDKVDAQKVYAEAYAQGRKDALDLRNVSQDLEESCINLWFGKDGPNYWKMRKHYEQAERTQSK